ncbi:MAG TPA: hypothetical protein VIT92_00565 [Burkholderiaceae bacterium]
MQMRRGFFFCAARFYDRLQPSGCGHVVTGFCALTLASTLAMPTLSTPTSASSSAMLTI